MGSVICNKCMRFKVIGSTNQIFYCSEGWKLDPTLQSDQWIIYPQKGNENCPDYLEANAGTYLYNNVPRETSEGHQDIIAALNRLEKRITRLEHENTKRIEGMDEIIAMIELTKDRITNLEHKVDSNYTIYVDDYSRFGRRFDELEKSAKIHEDSYWEMDDKIDKLGYPNTEFDEKFVALEDKLDKEIVMIDQRLSVVENDGDITADISQILDNSSVILSEIKRWGQVINNNINILRQDIK